jgi:hypothetical protein
MFVVRHIFLCRGNVAGQGGRLEVLKWKPTDVRFGSWPCQSGVRDVGPGRQDPGVSQAAIAAISGLTPTMFMTRVRL